MTTTTHAARVTFASILIKVVLLIENSRKKIEKVIISEACLHEYKIWKKLNFNFEPKVQGKFTLGKLFEKLEMSNNLLEHI